MFGKRRRSEEDFSAEIESHIDLETDRLIEEGMAPEEARDAARRAFGNATRSRERFYEAGRFMAWENLRRDVHYSSRRLLRQPRFAATALLTLALCLGANLTIFAMVDAILLRPLPFPEAGRLMSLYNTYPKAGVERDGASLANYYERRGHIAALAEIAIYRAGAAIVGDPGATEREEVTRVSPEFFSTLGVTPAQGRTFTESETAPGADTVVMLSAGYWRERLGADPNVLGRDVRVNGVPRRVVGVLKPDFRFLSSEAGLYLPLVSSPEERGPSERHSGTSTSMIARLAPSATLADAQSQIDAHNAAVEADDPMARSMADAGFRTLVVPLHADHVAAIRPTLLLMEAGVLFLLVIGAANLVNLLLIRAVGRLKEAGIRQAIGAGRRHVISQVMAETTLLTVMGGVLGLGVGWAGIRLVGALGAGRLPLGAHLGLDWRSAVIALAAAVVLGLAIGVPVIVYNLHGRTGSLLRSESRGGTSGRAGQRVRHGFVVAQVALAFVLLTGASLLGASLRRVMALSPGFRPDHVLSGQITLPAKDFPGTSDLVGFAARLTEAIRREPGVVAFGLSTNVPLSGHEYVSAFAVPGYRPAPGAPPRGHYIYRVAGDYFAALGTELRGGRFLNRGDARSGARVCVVDEDFARRYWPQGGAVGQRLFQGPDERAESEAFTVVGVVGAVRQAELTESQALGAVYLPYDKSVDRQIFVVARTGASPEGFAATLRRVVRGLDPDLPVTDVRSMETRVADSLVARRSSALLIAVFAAVALLLTAVGTYGVLSYAVAERRREIGVRLALGAQPAQIRDQFLRMGLRLVTLGAALGVLGAIVAARAMRGMVFGVPALPLAALGGSLGILIVVTLAACLLPTRAAARVPPAEALGEP